VSEYISGNCRIIGMGFEVVNTTAEINKQGQCMAYRLPNVVTVGDVFVPYATTPPVVSTTAYRFSRFPPASIAKAQLLFGSRSWAAEKGAYVVSRQSGEDNPVTQPSSLPLTYLTTDVNPGSTAIMYSNNNVITGVGQNWPDVYSPFDISGVYFTGLSYTTTLTVNVRWFIERMPGPKETDLVVLATPSSPYDPLALEIYTQCLREMPPAVMLSENPLGEWFRSALAKVADYAPRIGSLFGGIPGVSLIGEGIGKGAGALRNWIPAPPLVPGTQSTTLDLTGNGFAQARKVAKENDKKNKKKAIVYKPPSRRVRMPGSGV